MTDIRLDQVNLYNRKLDIKWTCTKCKCELKQELDYGSIGMGWRITKPFLTHVKIHILQCEGGY